ncbi:MAG: DNA topoisomerase (ATP-hydrolyzing) [Succinivibrio dextrinosolvens]|nr:DNA topoisomerase (ATP-hydrolyzing) [Succinivibrio dextrinosolvens]
MSDNTENPSSQNSVESSEETSTIEVDTTQVRKLNLNVPPSDLNKELGQSFINYAMSVIKDRALPDVRDGLKPVHRRALFDMKDLGVTHKSPTKKSARIVGDVIGRFHPHGDTAVYETIVRMAQWFSMRECLIFGQGNFGDIDGDGAAAMRYTEVKLTRIATETLLDDLDENIVDFEPNYDGSETIATVLPAKFPNLLVNGASGIAVGMATNIPTHNLTEVVNSCIAYLENPNITLDELMSMDGCIKGPDFPTGGTIVGTDGIREAYATGKGRCIIRSKSHVEYDKKGVAKAIIVDEIPYVVHKADIVRQIRELLKDDKEVRKDGKKDKKIEGVKEVNDLSDKDNAVKIEIVLKGGAFPEAVLNNLYQKTSLQSSFPINMVALSKGKPKLLTLLNILDEFMEFRRNVVTRRTSYWLKNAKKDAHTQEGLLVAKANIQRVIDLITSSANSEEAKAKLIAEPWDGEMINTLIERTPEGINIALPLGIPADKGYVNGKYYLSVEQAESILRLQLSKLTHLAQDEIRDLYKKLLADIHDYLDILTNPERLKKEIREELIKVRETFGNARKTDFTYDMSKFNKADLIQRRDVIVTLSAQGFIKYQEVATYESQSRGGKGKLATKVKGEDYVTKVIVASTHDKLMCFTNKGRVFVRVVYDLPTYSHENRTSQGSLVQNIFNNLDAANGECITAMVPISEFNDDDYFFMATKKGLIKKTSLSAYKSFVSRLSLNGMKAVNLNDDDELIGVEVSSGDDDIFLFTSNGYCQHFCEFYKKKTDAAEEENAEDNDETDSSQSDDSDDDSSIDRHSGSGVRPSGRGSGCIRGIKLRDDGEVVSLMVVPPKRVASQQCLIASSNGFGKRMELSSLSLRNRGGMGIVIMKNLERNGQVIGAVTADEKSDFMLITNQGQLIRSPMSDISVSGRYAAGNILMRMYQGDSVVAMQAIPEDVVENAKQIAEARAREKEELKREEEIFNAGAAEAADSAVNNDANPGNSQE